MGIPPDPSTVSGYAVVGVVAPHHRRQVGVLIAERLMPVIAGTTPSPPPARGRNDPFAVTCRTTFLPFRDRPHTWVKPRKSNVVPPSPGDGHPGV